MGRSLADLTAEIRAVNVEKGWRVAEGGPGANTLGDYIALLHSEVSEALEAHRDHRLTDATADHPWGSDAEGSQPKPEGVGSEFADVLIRLLDMADVFGIKPFDMDCELADVDPLSPPAGVVKSFGDHVTFLHYWVAQLTATQTYKWSHVLRAVVAVAERYGIDLTAEVERKIAYNRTREFQHGGRTVADAGTA